MKCNYCGNEIEEGQANAHRGGKCTQKDEQVKLKNSHLKLSSNDYKQLSQEDPNQYEENFNYNVNPKNEKLKSNLYKARIIGNNNELILINIILISLIIDNIF